MCPLIRPGRFFMRCLRVGRVAGELPDRRSVSMASYCPHCGAPAPEEARFCMKCGKERLPEQAAQETPPAPAEAPAVPASPPPPAYTPGPTAPSPVGAFLGRTFRGDWAGSLQAALWPVALLLIGAMSLAIPAYGQDDEVVVDFTDRLRIALALLLQSVGGGFELTGREQRPTFGGSDGDGGLGTGMGSDASESALEGTAALHFVPLTVTVLWILALFIGVRVLRNRLVARGAGQGGGTAGLEAAVRVALSVTVGVLVLSLFAQPEIEGVELSSSPVLAALGALVLGLAVSCGVLHRHDLVSGVSPARAEPGAWGRTARPAAQAFVRATGTALSALAVVLVLCSVVAFISLTQVDDLAELTDLDDADISPLLVALLILPNLAVTALGIGWGAGAEASVRGSSSMYGSGQESGSFGLSELGDVTNDWAIVGALALGLVCALTLGVLAARRCAGRGEQLIAAGVFFGLVLLLAGFSGIGVEVSGQAFDGSSGFGGSGGPAGSGGVEAGLGVPEMLLFGMLWIFPAVLLAPYLLQMVGQRGGAQGLAQAVPPMPAPMQSPGQGTPQGPGTPPPGTSPSGTPVGMPPAGTPAATPQAALPTQAAALPTPPYGPHTVHLGHQTPAAKPRNRAGIWVATIAGAFLVGGGAAAGVLLWQNSGDDEAEGKGKEDNPSVSRSEEPSRSPSPVASQSPEASPAPTESAGVAGEPEVPDGSELVTDPEGFSFAAPEGWTRKSVNPERPGQITYAGSTGREEFLVGVVTDAPYTSYENFTNIEKHTKSAPDKSDYERVRMEENTFQGRDGALWEYTYTDKAGRKIHAINQSYVAQNGTEYAIQLSWREDFWPAGEGAKTHATALDTWRLTD
ncbi:zinc-ribbon domain-containing protein [Streptomyces sp. NPDC041068]|uniref:zinc-ribbon domain-containing protein n=1 Tax=Streptomyces sp. NPDC041068 TaxID=3155130 RepID=UPI0033F77663